MAPVLTLLKKLSPSLCILVAFLNNMNVISFIVTASCCLSKTTTTTKASGPVWEGYMTFREWGLCGGGLSQGMSSEVFSLLPDCSCSVTSRPHAFAAMPFLPWWNVSLSTASQSKAFLSYVAFVGVTEKKWWWILCPTPKSRALDQLPPSLVELKLTSQKSSPRDLGQLGNSSDGELGQRVKLLLMLCHWSIGVWWKVCVCLRVCVRGGGVVETWVRSQGKNSVMVLHFSSLYLPNCASY